MDTTPGSIDAGVAIGEIFLEKYRVDAFLGHGGMGVVASCTHLALNERVAIKMLRRDVVDDADAVERFMREAQAASKLKSEYVARVTDVGRSPTNVPYMIMEYLEGHDLGELIGDHGSIGMPWAIELTLQACEALAEAHSIGIVHRDIKPTNLFVTWRPDGSALVKVLDFGISKAMTASSLQLTQTQSLLGTPAYMSPEQMRSARQVDARTDIWSLGIVLYELLEGRRPFEAESFSEMCIKVAVDPPLPMTKAPMALQQVVMRCLAKLPEQRYASMAELGAELVAFSHDTHQAQVLVERMTRTLQRGQLHEWDVSYNGAAHAQRPIMARGSDPTFPVLNTPPPVEQLPSQTLRVPRRARRGWIVVAAVSAAATIGVVVSLTRDVAPSGAPARSIDGLLVPEEPTGIAIHNAPPSEESVGDGTIVAKPAAGEGESATGTPAGVVVPVVAPSPAPSVPATEAPSPSVGSTDAVPEPKRAVQPALERPTRPGRTKRSKASAKDRRKGAKDTMPAPRAPCDPFADPHGCESSGSRTGS